mmetsp:Transcript_6055/g.15431  ORF Transcript_6055/g.15431 Transcript_6055/m.15431 type:complete len:237 (+) Transcript_6055:219-929(+)
MCARSVSHIASAAPAARAAALRSRPSASLASRSAAARSPSMVWLSSEMSCCSSCSTIRLAFANVAAKASVCQSSAALPVPPAHSVTPTAPTPTPTPTAANPHKPPPPPSFANSRGGFENSRGGGTPASSACATYAATNVNRPNADHRVAPGPNARPSARRVTPNMLNSHERRRRSRGGGGGGGGRGSRRRRRMETVFSASRHSKSPGQRDRPKSRARASGATCTPRKGTCGGGAVD